MKNMINRMCKSLLFLWTLWSSMLTCREWIRFQIPSTLYLYEEEAAEVLSNGQEKLNAETLYLDFAGDVKLQETESGGYEAVCHLFGMIPIKTMEVSVVEEQQLIPGGIPVGVYVETKGVFVIGTGKIDTENGTIESPAQNILKTGDYITSVQGKEIQEKQQLISQLKSFQGDELIVGVRRNEEDLEVSIHPVAGKDGPQIGVWVRDDTQGVGTLTYVSGEGKFGALGHGISDVDSELLMEVSKGKLYDCEIFQITKGERGTPGKLSGKIIYSQDKLFGEVTGNLSGGIYGTANQKLMQKLEYEPMPIALKQEVTEGEVLILSSVSGELKEYKAEIKKLRRGEDDVNKGMELTVTDPELLELTGGIVQGMSGSPIIQDGKLVGAVTHVLVNDPTRGYGIFIENMLEH